MDLGHEGFNELQSFFGSLVIGPTGLLFLVFKNVVRKWCLRGTVTISFSSPGTLGIPRGTPVSKAPISAPSYSRRDETKRVGFQSLCGGGTCSNGGMQVSNNHGFFFGSVLVGM